MAAAGRGAVVVRVLGAVELTVDGVAVDLGGAQPRAIVAYLAMDAGRVVSVERLIDRLWGDDPPRTPLGTLQSYVSRLRRLIEPGRGAGTAAQVLVSEAPGYRLCIEPDQVDAHRFTALADTARRALAAGDPATALARADEALALWRGEPLAGIGPDERVRPLVVPLVEQHEATVEDRFEALLALGRDAEAIPALQAACELAPLREGRWGLLARALYREGRQADALRALGAAREHLVEELGLDPGPELRELERRILDHDPSLLRSTPAHPAATPAEPAEPTAPAPPAAPAATPGAGAAAPAAPARQLVGRRKEWSLLARALDLAERGAAQLVLVEGEPGIGKSTLAEALVAHAAERGWHTAVGRCVETGLAPSLWPAMEIVRELVRATGEAGPAVVENPLYRFAIEQVVPATGLTSVELVEQFVELLDALGTGPTVVVVDDAHWADQATLDVITVAAQRLDTRPVVVVLTYRPPGVVPGSLLTEALGRFRRLPMLTPIAVAPLSTAEVAELMEQTAGVEPPADIAAEVRDRTGGNPLFVSELSRLAGERGVADAHVVPDAIRDVVRERLAQLPERATAELEVAAVVGERFSLRTVIAASDRSPDACLDALDSAIVTRILVPDGADYRFSHALVRDAVLADISPMRRERLHAAVADALVAAYGDSPDVAEPVAYHRMAARTIVDPVVVATSAVRAADVARWKNALDEAERLAEAALATLAGVPRSPAVSKAEVGALEAVVAVAYRRGGEIAHEEFADRIDQVAARSRSESAAALALFLRFGRVDEHPVLDVTEPLVAKVRDLAEHAAEPYAQVMLRYMLCSWDLLRGRIPDARHHAALGYAASGAEHPDALPDHVPLVMLPLVTAITAALAGDAVAARDDASRRMKAWLAQRTEVDSAATQNVVFARFFVAAILGEPAEVQALAREYKPIGPLGLFTEQDDVREIFTAWAEARLTGAADLTLARAALAKVEASPEVVLQAALRCFVADAAMASGDREAVELLATARAEAEGRGEVWWLAEIIRLQAVADAHFGDGTRRAALLEEAAAIARDQGAKLLVDRIAATAS